MGVLHQWKKQAVKASGKQRTKLEQTVRRQLAGAAGASYFHNRDPVSCITEDFQTTFDRIGTRRAEQLSAMVYETQMPQISRGLEETAQADAERKETSGRPWEGEREAFEREAPRRERSEMDRMVQPSPSPGDRMFLQRFSQMAFQRGTMAGAVLNGSGKMMLFSCLKRTAGQSQPINQRQQKLFEASSQRRNVAGSPPDQVIFNRGQVDSAVGLVVDVLRDSRRVVDSMSKLAEGKNALAEKSGAETLRKTYPFLSDRQERALLEEYRAKLAIAQTPQDKAVLQHAIAKAQALIDKKQQMKQRFITALRAVSDAASGALADFTRPGFSEELARFSAREAAQAPPDDKGGGDGSNRRRTETGQDTTRRK